MLHTGTVTQDKIAATGKVETKLWKKSKTNMLSRSEQLVDTAVTEGLYEQWSVQ